MILGAFVMREDTGVANAQHKHPQCASLIEDDGGWADCFRCLQQIPFFTSNTF